MKRSLIVPAAILHHAVACLEKVRISQVLVAQVGEICERPCFQEHRDNHQMRLILDIRAVMTVPASMLLLTCGQTIVPRRSFWHNRVPLHSLSEGEERRESSSVPMADVEPHPMVRMQPSSHSFPPETLLSGGSLDAASTAWDGEQVGGW